MNPVGSDTSWSAHVECRAIWIFPLLLPQPTEELVGCDADRKHSVSTRPDGARAPVFRQLFMFVRVAHPEV
jgi:hypothetical protein